MTSSSLAGRTSSAQGEPARSYPCNGSSGTGQSLRPLCARMVRSFFTIYQGRAERAGLGLASAHAKARRDGGADCRAALRPPVAGGHQGNRDAPGRRLPSFGPSGHVGADAHSPPQPTSRAARRNVSGDARCCKRGHPSGARILKPCVLAVKSARCARVAAPSLPASGLLRRRDSGAPIGGMARTERIIRQAR
jgi:hypothetical protein